MTWEEFYDKSYLWAPSTLTRGISQLKELGPPDDVVDIALGVCDDSQAAALIRKQLRFGIIFSEDNIQDLYGYIPDDLLGQAIQTAKPPFSEVILEILEGVGSVDAAEYVVGQMHQAGYPFTEEQVEILSDTLLPNTVAKLTKEATAYFQEEELLSEEELFELEFANYPVKKHGFFQDLMIAVGTVKVLDWIFGKKDG